jgi:hypothetical protein
MPSAALNLPLRYLGVAFNADPFDGAATPSWVDLTARAKVIGGAGRGRQYELDQFQAGAMSVDWLNIDEALNPANTGSPYSPNLLPYRQILFMAQWPAAPVGGAVNLINLAHPDYPVDPSFESYATGSGLPANFFAAGTGVVPTITTTNPQQGTKSLTYNVVNGGGTSGVGVTIQCIPGKLYTSSWYVRQTGANTTQIFIDGGAGGSSTTTTGAYVRLSVTWVATQPTHRLWVASFATSINSTVNVDAVQNEPTTPANANPYFESPLLASSWVGTNGAVLTSDATQAHEGGYSLRVTPNGVSAVPQAQSEEIACVAGQDVAIYGWLRSNTAATRTLNVFWFNAAHTFLSSSPISTALGAGTWTQYGPTTFTAPATAAFYRLVSNDPGTPTAANFWNLDQAIATSPSAFATTGPLVRSVWTRGYVERWPTSWDVTGFEGRSSTPCVGPLAILNNAYLHTELRGAIMAAAPSYYWPLSEGQNATTFAEASGNNGPPLRQTFSTGGAGPTFAPGTQMNAVGDPGGVGVRNAPNAGSEGVVDAAFTNMQLGWDGGPNLVGPAAVSGSGTSWSSSVAFVMTRPAVAFNGAQYVRFVNTGQQLAFGLSGISASRVFLNPLGTAIADLWGDGKPHIYILTFAMTAAGGGTLTQTAYVDGVQVGTGSSITGSTAYLTAMMLNVGGVRTSTFSIAGQDQTVSHIAYWNNKVLSAFEIANITNGFKGYVGETESARFTRYLSVGGFVGQSTIGASATTMGAGTVAENDTLLSSVQDVGASVFGSFYEYAGGLAYASRFARYLATTSLATLGENGAGGEYPYEGDINFDLDPTLVLNVADITRNGGVVAHAEDTTGVSQKRYGRKNFTRTVSTQSDNETIDAATWIVASRKAPLNRVNAITLSPGSVATLPFGDGTMWAMIIALEIGTRVTVKRRAKAANAGAGITISGDFFVESINHHVDFEAASWQTTLQLSPVPAAQPWILENATYGVLDSTTVLGF